MRCSASRTRQIWRFSSLKDRPANTIFHDKLIALKPRLALTFSFSDDEPPEVLKKGVLTQIETSFPRLYGSPYLPCAALKIFGIGLSPHLQIVV